jgi:hypothetical protein
MKRLAFIHLQHAIRLDLPLAELKVLLGDDEGLIEHVGTDLMACDCCGLPHSHNGEIDIHLDDDSCLILSQKCNFCGQGDCLGFVDTTDLPEWQHILRHLLRQQFGLNSLGDE